MLRYGLSQIVFSCLIPFLPWILWQRKDTRSRLWHFFGALQPERGDLKNLRGCEWLHAVSYGEMLSALAFWEHGRDRGYIQGPVLITTTIESAARLALDRTDSHVAVMFLPLDWHPVMEKLVRTVAPKRFFLVETDFWPCLLSRLRKYGAQTYLINGRISHKIETMFGLWPKLFAQMLDCFHTICVCDASDQNRLGSLSRVSPKVIGQFKYDAVQFHLKNRLSLPKQDSDQPLILFVSWHVDEIPFLKPLLQNCQHLRIWIAPRKPEQSSAFWTNLSQEGLHPILLSATRETLAAKDCLILDKMGYVPTAMQQASFCVIGGSFNGIGGHNFLEPIAAKRPVASGPNLRNLQADATEFAEKGFLYQVQTGEELCDLLLCYQTTPRKFIQRSVEAAELFENKTGAIEQTWQLIHRSS